MRELARQIITCAAVAAGLDAKQVINIVAKDNLTLARPRIELQWLPAQLARTGRLLGVRRKGTDLITKRELYQVRQEVSANILAEDATWLEAFVYEFFARLPRGVNDARNNWVKIRAEKTDFQKPEDKRVGDSVIEVFKKCNEVCVIRFDWRITEEEAGQLVPELTTRINIRGA